MSAVVFLLVCFLSCSVSEDPQRQQITAHPGGDVTLPCRAPNNVTISAVQWIRPDLERHVYLKIDGYLNTADQDPSYVNRVQLKDDEMKNGELSLILKNVTNNDEGTYVCWCGEGRGISRKSKLSSIVYLHVKAQQETAKPGDDVTLSCEAPNNVPIAAVKWTRSDLDRYIFMKRGGRLVTADQDPSYVNRVQLKDDEMKNGELSLILKNVNNNDEGTYVCRCKEETAEQSKLISIVYLKVEGHTVVDSEGGDPGVTLLGILNGLVVVVVVGLVGLVIYEKLKGRSKKKQNLPVVDPEGQQLQKNGNSQKNITHNISDAQMVKLHRN